MTIKSYPTAYSSVNSPLIWVVYDAHSLDAVTYPNYKYVAECYVNGTLIATSRKFQDPTNNFGVFDFSAEIREYVNASLPVISTQLLAKEMGSGQFNIDVQVDFKEEYNGTIGGVVATDIVRTFYNHYNGRTSQQTILASLINDALSDRKYDIDIFLSNDYFFIPYFKTSSGSFSVTITANSTVVKTLTAVHNNSIQLLNISPIAINASAGTTIIDNNTKSYTIDFGANSYNCNLICEPVHTNYPVHFLNKYGGFESFNFYKARRQTFEIERKSYKQLPYTIDGSTGAMNLKNGVAMNEQTTMFGVRYKEKLKVQSNLLGDSDWQFLEQLINSPLIYLEDNGTLYPVTISESSYEVKQIEIDNYQTLSIEFDFGTTYKTQFR
jgi:hypothetical protein